MKKNDLLKKEDSIIRVLEIKGDKALVIDCIKRTMPKWIGKDSIADYEQCTEKELIKITCFKKRKEEEL